MFFSLITHSPSVTKARGSFFMVQKYTGKGTSWYICATVEGVEGTYLNGGNTWVLDDS